MNGITDLTHLKWTYGKNSSGVAGVFPKATEECPKQRIYYKMSEYDPDEEKVIGHECLNEIYAQIVCDLLQIPHLHYDFLTAKVSFHGNEFITNIVKSVDFSGDHEEKMTLNHYYMLFAEPSESPLDFLLRFGFQDYLSDMFLLDWVIMNVDRHRRNIEVLIDKRNGSIRLAPTFDHGLSLHFSYACPEDAKYMNFLDDPPTVNYVGSERLSENLKYVLPRDFPEVKREHFNVDKDWDELTYRIVKERMAYAKKMVASK